MVKYSKTVLFFTMLICAVMGGFSLHYADWSVWESGEGIVKEFQTPVLLLILSVVFMVMYVNRLKSKRNNDS